MANKLEKGFNVSDIPLELCLLQGEIAELFEAWRTRSQSGVSEELADVAIYLLGLAEMIGVDLEAEIEAKVRKNAARIYEARDGVLTKIPV
ncbi:MAG TPA: MazG-like family protein [Longimicrobiaceae bacterium]|nr:MazG-like family protein [Longimicrobiaceae bacterium]